MDNQSGGLQKYVQDIMERAGTQLPGLMEQRDTAQQNYLTQLQRPVDTGPSDIAKYGQMMEAFSSNGMRDPAGGLSKALQSYGDVSSRQESALRQRADQAASEGARQGSANVNQAIAELKAVPSLTKSAGLTPKDEEVRTVYTSARNEAAQIAKMYNFPSAEEAIRWIDGQANMAVESYLKRFAISPSGRGQGILPTEIQTAQGTSAPRVGMSTTTQPPIESPIRRNPAEEERKKEFATGLEKGAIKDFEENVKPQAAIADSMLNTIGMLKQIPRTQDAFAPWREKLGSGLQAIGMDGNMINEAESLQQVRPLLAKIANDRLLAAKGVQTEGDAQRSYNEFLKITDTQKAADFMYAWTEELANRNKFRKSVWEDSAQTEGTMGKAGKAWENTDYSKTAPVAILNGKPWTYTAWRNAFVKANPDVPLNETIDIWNKLARGEK